MTMEDRSEINGDQKMEEIMLPGFRFHPTDEELVGFYLKMKIKEGPISIDIIKPLDIYKHDPWDLPKLATTGEKEWYFYCPRGRKYRNGARPNRVTGAGFWKATGTDRPVYSSDGSKCIGLKKSLVFYKGRASKGLKTDWMMHEFRLPSGAGHIAPTKRFIEKTIPPDESWAICRIFKKPSSRAQRALTHSWVSPIHSQYGNDFQHLDHKNTTNISIYKPSIDPTPHTLTTNYNKTPQDSISRNEDLNPTNYPFLAHEPNYYSSKSPTIDDSSLLFNMPTSIFQDFAKQGLDYGDFEDQWDFSITNNCYM